MASPRLRSGLSVKGLMESPLISDSTPNQVEYDVSNHPLIQQRADFYNKLMNRQNGAQWLEANSSLQVIMNDYIGLKVRSEDMMRAGIKYLADLKSYAKKEKKYVIRLMCQGAKRPHLLIVSANGALRFLFHFIAPFQYYFSVRIFADCLELII